MHFMVRTFLAATVVLLASSTAGCGIYAKLDVGWAHKPPPTHNTVIVPRRQPVQQPVILPVYWQ